MEKDVLAKGLNFVVTSEEVSVVDLIISKETAIRNYKPPEAEAEKFRLNIYNYTLND